MRRFVARNPLALFMAGSLGLQLGLVLIVFGLEDADRAIRYGMPGPLLFAVALTWYLDGYTGLRKLLSPLWNWRVPGKWYVVAFTWKFICAYVGIALVAISGLSSGSGPAGAASMTPLLGNVPFIACTSLVEVIAWMLFGINRLQDRTTALWACIFIALCRAAWYLPLMITGEGMPDGLPWWILLVSLFSSTVLMAWMYNMTQSGPVLFIAQMTAHSALTILTMINRWSGGLAMVTACASASLLLAGSLILWYGPEHLCNGRRARWSDAVMRLV